MSIIRQIGVQIPSLGKSLGNIHILNTSSMNMGMGIVKMFIVNRARTIIPLVH